MSPEGSLVDDFHFVQGERELHVVNAPSPAATSSLAIGEEIAGMVASIQVKHMTSPTARARAASGREVFSGSLLGMLASGYFAVLGSGYLDWPTAIFTLAALCLRALTITGIVTLDVPGRIVTALTVLYIGFYPIDYYYISKGIPAGRPST